MNQRLLLRVNPRKARNRAKCVEVVLDVVVLVLALVPLPPLLPLPPLVPLPAVPAELVTEAPDPL